MSPDSGALFPASDPRTESAVVVPGTGAGVAAAAVAMVGATVSPLSGSVRENGVEATPLATTLTEYVLAGIPSGSVKFTVSVALPVCTPVLLQLEERA